MKVKNIQFASQFKLHLNSRKQNNSNSPCLLNSNSFDNVSFCRKHATKTEIKKLEHQGKIELRNAKKIHKKAQQLEKQGSKLLSVAKTEYQQAIDYIKLVTENSFVELQSGNSLHLEPLSGEDISSFYIREYDKNSQLVREILVNDFKPQTVYISGKKDSNSLEFAYFDDLIQIDVCADEVGDSAIETSYFYRKDKPVRVLTNVRIDSLSTTADEEFEFMHGELNACNLGYIEHETYIKGYNDQRLEKSYDKQYEFNGNKLHSVAIKVNDYGMLGLTWDEALYFKNNNVVKYELDAKQVSADNKPIYMNDTPRACAERIRLLSKVGQYIKETDVLYDSFWDYDYRAL